MSDGNKQKIESKRYWIWFSLLTEINNKIKRNLIIKYKDPKIIYELDDAELMSNSGIGKKAVCLIQNKLIKERLDDYIEKMNQEKINILTIQDKEYPRILRQIYDYPITLYIKGNNDILNNTNIAIIGCRDCTEYGKKAAEYFSYNLAKENVTIVSGLARGIDGYSHIGALKAKGKTIAVLGNGLDIVYPKQNEIIYQKIIEENGAIVSEYPLGTKPEKNNFPERNRIISGISKGVLIIEAKERSGTIVTADFALEQGRDVYVVPGNINSPNSVGTNRLIKEGAMLVTNYKDILEILWQTYNKDVLEIVW